MKILLLGATGRTGAEVLSLAKERNLEVHAIARDPSKLGVNLPELTMFEGTSLDSELVGRAMKGCDAVISCLNLGRTSDNPFAKLTAPEDLLSTSIKNALTSMENNGVKRIVVMSAWGVGDQINETPWYFRLLVKHSNVKYAYDDHERQEGLLQNSNIEWTIVRPVSLMNKDELKTLIITNNNYPKPSMSISRKHVARFMLDAIENSNHIHEVLTVSER